MRFKSLIPLALCAAIFWQRPARADVPVVQQNDWKLNIGGMGQLLGSGELLSDPTKNDARAYLFMKEARLRASGGYKDYTFDLELALGGESGVAAPNPGVGLSLLDFSFNIPIHALGASYVKAGQFKVPYGREALTYSGYTQFADRSINFLGFDVGRDVGVTFNGRSGNKTLIAGVFTGGGRDVPQEYIPEKLGVPLLVVRAGIGDVDDDLYRLKQNDPEADHTKMGIYASGLYTKDSLLGHSTVLNVKLTDKSLLLNSNWNPYIAKAPFDQGSLWQTEIDAAVRKPLGDGMSLAAEAEVNYGGYFNKYGAVHLFGGRAQGSIGIGAFEVALRYAILLPDQNFANSGRAITGSDPIHELTPAVSYAFFGNSLKVIADLPVLFQVPVFTEQGVGSYVATQMPNEASVLTKEQNTVARQNVVEGRLMLQAQF